MSRSLADSLVERGRARLGSYRLLGAAVRTLSLGALFVSVARMGREMFVAREFGVGPDVDALVIALVVPMAVVGVISSATQSSIVPAVVAATNRSPRGANFIGSVVVRSKSVAIFTGLAAIVATPVLSSALASPLGEGTVLLTARLSIPMSLLVPLAILASVWRAVLHAHQRFGIASLAPALVPVSVITSMFVYADAIGIYSIAVGFVLGAVGEVIVLHRAVKHVVGVTSKSIDPNERPHATSAAREWKAVAIGSALMGSTVLIDTSMAAALGPGSASSLNYSLRVPSFAAGFGTLVIGSAILPRFAELTASTRPNEAFKHLRVLGRTAGVVGLISSIVLIGLSAWIVQMLFEGGSFSSADTRLVTDLQRLYLLQLPPLFMGIVGVRLINALNENRLVVISGLVNVVSNTVGNIVFAQWFGLYGIPIATIFMYCLSLLLILYFVRRLQRGRLGNGNL